MKILYRKSEIGAGKYIGIGIKNGFIQSGHDVLLWDGKDMERIFTEFKPDLFFANLNNLNEVNIDFLNDSPFVKTVAWSYPWCTSDTSRDMLLVTATPDQAAIVKEINNFKGIITNYTQKNAEKFYHKWKDIGIDVISFPLAADTATYYPAEPKDRYKCDLSYVGNYWEKKAKDGIDKYILPLKEKHDLKIWGEWGWPAGLSSGKLPFGADRDVFCSSKINLSLHEPHSRNLGIDVISRIFNIPACKAFQVSDYVKEINDFFRKDEIIMCKDAEDYHDKVAFYLKHPGLRAEIAEKAYRRVLREHTYKHRVNELLTNIR